jgi:hypothetical protein
VGTGGSTRIYRTGRSASGEPAGRLEAHGQHGVGMLNKLCNLSRLNARLEPAGYPLVSDLGADFADGTRLIQLLVSSPPEAMPPLAGIRRLLPAQSLTMISNE